LVFLDNQIILIAFFALFLLAGTSIASPIPYWRLTDLEGGGAANAGFSLTFKNLGTLVILGISSKFRI
jgi:hypothetical protein